MGIIKSLFKFGIGGGTVYYVFNSGLCKEQERSIGAYRHVLKSVPFVKEYVDKIPTLSSSKHEIASYWNSGVKTSFSTLASLPQYTKDGTKKGYDYLVETIKSQTVKK